MNNMRKVSYSKRYSKEAEDIESKFQTDFRIENTFSNQTIHKTDSDKNVLIFDKTIDTKKINPSSLSKETRVIDFNVMNNQILQKNNQPVKVVNFQNSSAVPLNEFKSITDVNDFINNFGARDSNYDAIALKKMGLKVNEIFLGEYIIDKTDQIEFLLNNFSYPGSFIITNYRFIFWPKNDNFYDVVRLQESFFKAPLMHIDKVMKSTERKNNLNFVMIEIITKDFRELTFKFPGEINLSSGPGLLNKPYEKIYQLLLSCSFPKFREIYAAQFAFYLKSLDEEHQGWKLYDIKEEFFRQGLEFVYNPLEKEATNLRYIDNQNGRICSTYPFVLAMPSKLTDENVQKSAAFRSRERLPVLTYCYQMRIGNNKTSKVYLWRASQCKAGVTAQRCPEDELLLKFLGERASDGSGTSTFLKIFDARPYLNAMVNKLDGKGYENTSYYKNADLRFLGIHNIQKVRDAFRKLCNACYNSDEEKWFSQIEGWFNLLNHILSGTLEIVSAMKKGYNCLIHCSDGWDRTSQLLSLIQIMLDPYYRTIEGFMVLIEKDWISFGHQFALRCGHSRNNNDDQKSPIFLQFLDCVHQLMNQFPLSFEFNNGFLVDIAFHTYSCYFGTFLYDTVLERTSYQTHERTLSLWSYLLASKEKYVNSFYKSQDDIQLRELFPSVSIKFLRLWKEFFLRHLMDSKDKYNFDYFSEGILMKEYSLAIKEKILLRQEINKLRHELEIKNNEIKHEEAKNKNEIKN